MAFPFPPPNPRCLSFSSKNNAPGLAKLLLKRGWNLCSAPPALLAEPWIPPGYSLTASRGRLVPGWFPGAARVIRLLVPSPLLLPLSSSHQLRFSLLVVPRERETSAAALMAPEVKGDWTPRFLFPGWKRQYQPAPPPRTGLSGSQEAHVRKHKIKHLYLDLQDTLLHNAELRDTLLHNAELRGTLLHYAELRDTLLHNAELRDTLLHNAELRDTLLHNAEWRDTLLHNAEWRDTLLHNAEWRDTLLHNAELRDTLLHNAELRDTLLHNAELRDTFLHNAELRDTFLHNAELRDTLLNNAEMRDTLLPCFV
ncbi:hypothetical protein NDU88_006881 [Pleurodeles waltl]|uniref:Uncharacterized protein n=1 Tax=Pleurodeles waltl TaxID=8319 RepID=A0AAV7LS23_PLEWA|nr:hypothetical protein NDU88_006881 [Pleurodeles waltl]